MKTKFIVHLVTVIALFLGCTLEKQSVAPETSNQEGLKMFATADGQEQFVDGIAGTWTYAASMPQPRSMLAAATGLDGTIYAIGGMYPNDINHADTYSYDPVTNSWSTVASMNYARNSLAAATGPDGKIYAIGGFSSGSFRNWVEMYDPQTNTWSTKSSMPTARSMLGAAAVDGKIYAIGGRSFWAWVHARVEMYDPQTNTWSIKSPMPTPRKGLGVAVADGKIYAIGGAMPGTSTAITTVEAYDPQTDTWSTKSPMPGPRYRFQAVTGPDGKIYVIGGMDYGGHAVSGVMAYDPGTDTWSGAPGLPCHRTDQAAAVGQNATIYAIGGYSYCNYGYTNTVLAYSPVRVVSIDIKPGSIPNSINCNNPKEVITVAILTTDDFDATTVDHNTVIFEGASETHVNNKDYEARRHEEDVDGDGKIDLVLHFRLENTTLTCTSTEGTLTGETFDGKHITGSDTVNMIDTGDVL